jgi:hypothetical protein
MNGPVTYLVDPIVDWTVGCCLRSLTIETTSNDTRNWKTKRRYSSKASSNHLPPNDMVLEGEPLMRKREREPLAIHPTHALICVKPALLCVKSAGRFFRALDVAHIVGSAY